MTLKTSKTPVVARVDDLLRGKLTDIRDTAMELSAILEFGKPDGIAADPLWRFAQTVIEGAEALLPIAQQKRHPGARQTARRVAELAGGPLRKLLPPDRARRRTLRRPDCEALAVCRRQNHQGGLMTNHDHEV